MTLVELIAAARKTNKEVVGVAIINQNFESPAYVAICMSRGGKATDPRSWNTHPTPEAALADLERQLTK